jgi:magnesium transporter
MMTDPALQVGNVIQQRLVTLPLDADMSEIADMFLRYSFLYLPVVDNDGVLLGVISFKHAFDQLLPHLYRVWKQD